MNINEIKQKSPEALAEPSPWLRCLFEEMKCFVGWVVLCNPRMPESHNIVLISLKKHSQIFGFGERRKFSHMLELLFLKGIFVY